MAANIEELGNMPDDQIPPASEVMPAVLEGMVANVSDAANPDRWVVLDDATDGDPFLVSSCNPATAEVFDGATQRVDQNRLTDTAVRDDDNGFAVVLGHAVLEESQRVAAGSDGKSVRDHR